MIEGLILFAILLYLWTRAVFAPKPPPKSLEDQLGETLAKYLTKGVKVRIDPKDWG